MRGAQAGDCRGDQISMRTVKPSELLSEAAIQRQILDYLTLRGIFAWRNNSGAVKIAGKGKDRFMRFGMPGSADILGIFPEETIVIRLDNAAKDKGRSGRLWAIEVKAAKGKLSPAQESFRDAVVANGGKYTLARSVEDVIKALEG